MTLALPENVSKALGDLLKVKLFEVLQDREPEELRVADGLLLSFPEELDEPEEVSEVLWLEVLLRVKVSVALLEAQTERLPEALVDALPEQEVVTVPVVLVEPLRLPAQLSLPLNVRVLLKDWDIEAVLVQESLPDPEPVLLLLQVNVKLPVKETRSPRLRDWLLDRDKVKVGDEVQLSDLLRDPL